MHTSARDSGEMVPVLRFPPQRSFFLIFLIQSSPSSQGREAHTPQFRRPSEITAIIYDKPCLFEERVSSKHIQNGWKERKHCERQVWKENRIIKQIKAKVRTSTFQQHPSSCMHSLTFSHHWNDVSHHHRSGGKIHVYQRKSQERPKIMGNIGKTQLSIRTTEIE